MFLAGNTGAATVAPPAEIEKEITKVNIIKSVIDRNGAACWNNNHFERPTILNPPWDEHSMMFFLTV